MASGEQACHSAESAEELVDPGDNKLPAGTHFWMLTAAATAATAAAAKAPAGRKKKGSSR
jgi:hypothetical protein